MADPTDAATASSPEASPPAPSPTSDTAKASCPFFQKLPRELRDKIYEMAYAEEEEYCQIITRYTWAQMEKRRRRSAWGGVSNMSIEFDGPSDQWTAVQALANPCVSALGADCKPCQTLALCNSLRQLRLEVTDGVFDTLEGRICCVDTLTDAELSCVEGLQNVLAIKSLRSVQLVAKRAITLAHTSAEFDIWRQNVAALEAYINKRLAGPGGLLPIGFVGEVEELVVRPADLTLEDVDRIFGQYRRGSNAGHSPQLLKKRPILEHGESFSLATRHEDLARQTCELDSSPPSNFPEPARKQVDALAFEPFSQSAPDDDCLYAKHESEGNRDIRCVLPGPPAQEQASRDSKPEPLPPFVFPDRDAKSDIVTKKYGPLETFEYTITDPERLARLRKVIEDPMGDHLQGITLGDVGDAIHGFCQRHVVALAAVAFITTIVTSVVLLKLLAAKWV